MAREKYKSAALLSAVLAVLIFVVMQPRDERQSPLRQIAPQPDSPPVIEETPQPTFKGEIVKNTSFFDMMISCGLSPQEIKEVETSAKEVYDFRRVYPGQRYELYADSTGRLESLTFTVDEDHYIEVRRDGDDISAERMTFDFDIERKTASGLIQQSLFATLYEQQLPAMLGQKLSDIFAWDIDFFTDIHKNDYFRVIYEEKTRFDGLKRLGHIIAAEFSTQGKNHYAFLFENEEEFPDYFDENGKSLRKQLLKAPLSYTRISSSYSKRRFHPILRRYAPHMGIDYAAPTGTPVMTTGDGTVLTAGYRRGNGKYVKIRHNQNYITYYMHLSRFATGIKQGGKVKQGQVIGYVGATGYATGPHLDYRVKKNGRFVNPRKIKLPPAKPVSDTNMAAFLALKNKRLEELGGIPITDWRTEYYAGGDQSPASAGTGRGTDEAGPSHPRTAH